VSESLALLTSRPAVTDTVTLALDPNDAQRLADARNRVRRAESDLDRAVAAAAREGAGDDKTEAAQTADEAADAARRDLADLEAGLVTFTVHLKAVGPRRYEELLLAHQPTNQQRAAAKKMANGDPKAQPGFDEDKFPPALLAEAVERITFSNGAAEITGLSPVQADELWRSPWPQGDRILVLQTAQMLNQVSSMVEDLGKG